MADLTVSAAVDTLMSAADEAALRSACGVVIGTDVQAYDAELAAIAALTPTNGHVITGNGTTWVASAPAGGSGDVVGPASATDNAVGRFDSTTGKLIQNSNLIVGDDGVVSVLDGTTPRDGAVRIYNDNGTWDDTTNFERGSLYWSTNTLILTTQNSGTGTARDLEIRRGDALKIQLGANGAVTVHASLYPSGSGALLGFSTLRWAASVTTVDASSYYQMTEMTAPSAGAANTVRLYAEDNGSGKTRLMALFATGAAQQIAIEP